MGIALRRCTQRWRDVVPHRLLWGQEHAEHASVLGQPRKLWFERRLLVARVLDGDAADESGGGRSYDATE
jgi:hypothetical protein